MKVRAIITGATGMVGEGVLLECLAHPDVEHVLVINRRLCGYTHEKLSEIIHKNFYDLSPIQDKLTNYNACFFCAGVSSIGKNEDVYRKLTYDLTLSFAKTVSSVNKDMVLCYVSGEGTDSTEKGRLMWARVKGKTENDLMKLPFKKVYAFRPGFMKPVKGQKNIPSWGHIINWLYPSLKLVLPSHGCTLKEVGIAMINSVTHGFHKSVLEVEDIIDLSKL